MEKADLEWIETELPLLLDSFEAADTAVTNALIRAVNANKLRRTTFFENLGWEIAEHLQALWVFEHISLEEATYRANALSDHLLSISSDGLTDQVRTVPETPTCSSTSPCTTDT